ncbi:receptor-type tyrosine-protein phosphatase kappa-like isoform X2 [Clavelina lepadiformis]|uniref:protein-tyrosine-phosphatase n=1 Tax=Clavelina lepadiformis TaxID=159417 RepID=A0ABP0GCN8_CLALP
MIVFRRTFIVTFILLVNCFQWTICSPQGSCNFEGSDWLCGYEQPTNRDNFNWSYVRDPDGDNIMQINTLQHRVGETAQLITPEIQQKDTHCFSFKVYLEGENSITNGNTTISIPSSNTPGELNVYLLDHDNSALQLMLPVWNSTGVKQKSWLTIQLALNPRAYQIVFEAMIMQSLSGVIAINDVLVSPTACVSTPHFLRLGDKEVNTGHNESLKCLLWGHNGLHTRVVLQKSTGATLLPTSKKEHDDHLSAVFGFGNVRSSDRGLYRCVSGNATQVGVSNFAHLYVREPPRPKRSPKVVAPGSTHFVIQLNADEYTGDGPIIQTILYYRPVDGTWSDVHHISTEQYQLWSLQPDTEYELTVTLVRPGPGGTGRPGPKLRRKTICGPPKTSVQNVDFDRMGPHVVKVFWDEPDLSTTQCNAYTFVVKYRLHNETEQESDKVQYQSIRVQNQNFVTIPALESYSNYQFKVDLVNSVGSKETGNYIVQTLEGVPDVIPPESFVTTGYNDTTISLSWDPPVRPNGDIINYEVSFRGESSYDPNFVWENDSGLIQVSGNVQTLVLDSLHPGTSYQVSVRAKTNAGYGQAIEITARTDIAPPTMPQYPPPVKGDAAVVTPTTIEITIIPAVSNGAPISNYYVIVEDVTAKSQVVEPKGVKAKKSEGRKGKRKKKSKSGRSRRRRQAAVDAGHGQSSACLNPPISYKDALDANQSSYAGARFSPDEVTNELKFVVGDDSAGQGLENRPLDPNKDYNIYVRVESTVDGETKVSCVLVAQKGRVEEDDVIPFEPTTEETNPDNVIVIVDPGGGDKPTEDDNTDTGDDSNDSPTTENVPGEKDKSKQEQVMMYAAIGGAVVAILVISIVIIVVVMRYRRRNKASSKDKVVNPFEVRMMMSDMNSPAHTLLPISNNGDGSNDRQALMPDVVGYDHQDFLDKASENGGGTAYGAPSTDERFAVRVDDFHVHVSQMKATGGYGFREEFAAFPDGPSAAWTVADNPQNRGKNRYGNIMAYDHSRVILEPEPGFEDEFQSDYINASFINGYKMPSLYIATQAPTPDTVRDFWWMVWQEKTNVIVMVTNLVELGRPKCHKYWPDDRDVYGTIQVSLTNVEYMADYVVRSFVIQQGESYDVREVKQFHFTAWPDHGVPSRPTNLLAYIRKIKAYEPQGQGPTIVHCSAGSGRTGCFIVIDMMLDMAREEEIVDIHNTVRDLRSRRVNMVQTEEQYVFIHEAVLEALLCGETSVAADMLSQHYDDLITVDPQTHFAPIQEEFETLNVITPKLSDEECSIARLPRNRAKNRFMDVLPADRHLACLVTQDPADRDSNYINAVFIDSYTSTNSFLVTQMPLPSTVIDIWRLMYDYNCNSVVMMNDASEHDQTCSQYWPDKGVATFGPFTVEMLTQDDEVDIITRLFKIQNVMRTGEPYRLIQQFQLTNWPAAQPVPLSRNAVLRVIQLVIKWQTECANSGNSGRTLVHCVAGAGRSGSFVSCYNMCEQLSHEYSVDVFNIVQRLRNVRPQLVETLEQYRFCYEVGIEYADQILQPPAPELL